jgi:hypothetical protein
MFGAIFPAFSKTSAVVAALALLAGLPMAWPGPALADPSADALSVMKRLQGEVSEAEAICAHLTRRASAADPATRARLLDEIAATKALLAQTNQNIADIRRFLNEHP